MVPIDLQSTAMAGVDPVGQRHLLPVSTGATVLRSIGGVDSHDLPASLRRFVGKKLCELRPCRVRNTLGNTMIMEHPVDFEIFDCNHPKAVDDPPALLMSEVAPSIGNSLVNHGDNLAGLSPLGSAFLGFGELPLLPGKILLILAKEFRSGDSLSGRESSEGGEANVNTNGFRGGL